MTDSTIKITVTCTPETALNVMGALGDALLAHPLVQAAFSEILSRQGQSGEEE